MNKQKRTVILFALTVWLFCMVCTACGKKNVSQGEPADVRTEHRSAYATEWKETDSEDTDRINAAEKVQETEIEEIEEIEETELSYIELYGLEEVDQPENRTEEQVLQKLAELSEEYELVREVYENADAYSKNMLEHLANNPEMAAYVLGSLEADGSVTGGFTEKELEADFPLLLQYDPRWGYFEYGGKEMGLSGCGPTCLSMALLALTEETDVTPDKVAAYSTEKGYYVKGAGTAWALMDAYPALYGLTVTHPTLKEESMKAAIDEGKVLICSVKKGVFTAGGHFILIYGYDESGFMVNDPKCVARSNRTWTFGEFGSQLKRIWAIGQKGL